MGARVIDTKGDDILNYAIVTNLNYSGPGSLTEAMKWNSDETRTVLFEVAGAIRFPEDSWAKRDNPAAWKNCRNIIVRADTAPGFVYVTGSPVWLVDAENVSFTGLTHFLEPPTQNKNNEAGFWGCLRVISGEKQTRNVSWQNCAFIGGEDETCIWSATDMNPHAVNVRFTSCFFGYGTQKWRGGPHNHSIAATKTNEFHFKDNFCAHNNRRNPQADGISYIWNNVIYNCGTMAIGLYTGNHGIEGNTVIYGPNTASVVVKTAKPIQSTGEMNGILLVNHRGNNTYKQGEVILAKIVQLMDDKFIERQNKNIILQEVAGKGYSDIGAMFTAGPWIKGVRNKICEQAAQEALTGTGSWVPPIAKLEDHLNMKGAF